MSDKRLREGRRARVEHPDGRSFDMTPFAFHTFEVEDEANPDAAPKTREKQGFKITRWSNLEVYDADVSRTIRAEAREKRAEKDAEDARAEKATRAAPAGPGDVVPYQAAEKSSGASSAPTRAAEVKEPDNQAARKVER